MIYQRDSGSQHGKKINSLADDTCFLRGDLRSFQALFNTRDKFASFSGCKINLSESEAIHIGSLKGNDLCPFQEVGLTGRSNTFKSLGVNFSLNPSSPKGGGGGCTNPPNGSSPGAQNRTAKG